MCLVSFVSAFPEVIISISTPLFRYIVYKSFKILFFL